jgi:prophage tail gpP-like protein
MDDVGLTVRGKIYRGWQNVQIVRSLEAFVPNFNVGFVEQWYQDAEPIPINEGDPVRLDIDGDWVIDGYVDDSVVKYDANTHGANVIGRAKTGDLVDCSAVQRRWSNSRLTRIAEDICRPFGIAVTGDQTGGSAFRKFAIQEGESCHEALDRAARMRGIILATDVNGNLFLTRAGTRRLTTALELGKNIKGGERNGSWRDRYSEYAIKVQAAGSDDFFGSEASWIKRTTTDDTVDRYRPLTIVAENEDTGRELQERIDWERNTRIGRSRRVTYPVQGWHDDEGDLWEPNTLVRVKDAYSRIDAELLIVTVRYERSDQGTLTSLELTRPEAFDTIDFAPPKAKEDNDFFGDIVKGAKGVFGK